MKMVSLTMSNKGQNLGKRHYYSTRLGSLLLSKDLKVSDYELELDDLDKESLG